MPKCMSKKGNLMLCSCVLGGIASFQRTDADLQYLSWVAAAALEEEPHSLLLLLSPSDSDNAKKGQTCVFLLAGPAGELA